jgi:vacuolar-type H+-ATPase subunit E/Vma4
MAIEDILKTLDEQAQDDCDAVLGEANEHAKLILDDAQRSASEVHEGYARQIERVARAEAARVVNAARLEAKMIVSSAKGDGVSSVFDAVRDDLPGLRAASYDALFAELAAEAFEGLDGAIVVRVAPEDADRAARAVASAGLAAEIDATLPTAGGLVAEAYGGRIIRRNTLEDRLDRVGQFKQADVARVLFS